MDREQVGTIRLELKYCERCGGLLLRTLGSAVIYCTPCGKQMAELPPPRVARSHGGSAMAEAEISAPCSPLPFTVDLDACADHEAQAAGLPC
jgi:hypothetical protein